MRLSRPFLRSVSRPIWPEFAVRILAMPDILLDLLPSDAVQASFTNTPYRASIRVFDFIVHVLVPFSVCRLRRLLLTSADPAIKVDYVIVISRLSLLQDVAKRSVHRITSFQHSRTSLRFC